MAASLPLTGLSQDSIRVEINPDLDFHLIWIDFGPEYNYRINYKSADWDFVGNVHETSNHYILIDHHMYICDEVVFYVHVYTVCDGKECLACVLSFLIKFPCLAFMPHADYFCPDLVCSPFLFETFFIPNVIITTV